MDKKTLEDIRQIIVNEYLNKKDEILEQEKSDKITSEKANEQRTKLIGMMTAVEVIQKKIKGLENNKEDFICGVCGKSSSIEDIDNATNEHFKEGVHSISYADKNDYTYVCPNCHSVIGGEGFR